ncbi:plasmid pRiA4b ORF-3 family protein [Isoptericola sp. NEAU-Y5]|uniref:Plasmid pRiA4b ORF-3 family protein n=1 Tax=Isoptericola luteus TaxID=2879484 RepID=A0ABS7ZIK5_9MICO|nr:plasmid pRiA4b ORF-3 family protein [Isoptericola sp. NEAU-Y5]MCA5894842.1 plasmid pRiA4b ORF-3 family protein [Isoptericola sp. NEAU-Y5]
MNGDQEALLRQFETAIKDMGVEDLRALTGSLLSSGSSADRVTYRTRRPDPASRRSRRPRLPEPVVFRLRVDLVRAAPPIWRRLDVRSDLTLDVVHQVLQDAFAWTDSHLHRFTLGTDAWDNDGEQFLCPYDVEEQEDDESGVPEERVRLDETLDEPGDVLHYVYDYGDDWELVLKLEEVLPATAETPVAVCVGGRRGAPPEDCGSLRDADGLAEVLDDPAHFDPADVNTQLQRSYYPLRRLGLPAHLLQCIAMLEYDGDDLGERLVAIDPTRRLPEAELAAALRPYQWFLDRAGGGGIPLTAAGYLRPTDVEEVTPLIPAMAGWIGKANREDLTVPVADFRELLIRPLGLLRKYKGKLLLTRAGAAARRSPQALFDHLAARLVPDDDGFARDANLLVLAYAAVSAGNALPRRQIAETLDSLGYHRSDGRSVDVHALRNFEGNALDVLLNVATPPFDRRTEHRISPAAAALAYAALIRPSA